METKHTDIRPEPAEDTETVEEKKDREFLNKREDCYAIYQIDGSGERVFYHFMGMDYVTESGSMIRRQDYRMVYSDVLLQEDTLDSLYEKFNLHHPEDYTGYSLSVSDIIVIRKGELTEAYYVDSIGFERLNGHPQTEGWYFSGQAWSLGSTVEREAAGQEDLRRGQEHFMKEQLEQLIDEIETYLEMTDAINEYIRGFLNELGIDMEDLKEKKTGPKPEMKGKEQKPDRGFKM